MHQKDTGRSPKGALQEKQKWSRRQTEKVKDEERWDRRKGFKLVWL